ncbi:MAG: hypothetical protein PHP30_03710 [Bacteroidales bacterium]|nr:hypothetical protein [Bacteroidales bacterium]MDD2425942.1 hypothetical protein [Bacteroidales bacterium]MDD3989187.1 hypothetical protein [Bacteroidales bacterium]MDD4639004.1 hypothetical protein [Bacteroidales bacterium]
MSWYIIAALAAAVVCIAAFAFQFFKLLKMGVPEDLSDKGGDIGKAVAYSYTKAMMPQHKESAYLHLPTYAAGMIYHMGTFLSLALFLVIVILNFAGVEMPVVINSVIAALLFITSALGFAILIKRMVKEELKFISGADDYISNLLTTLFQLFSALYLIFPATGMLYFVCTALLFLWMPVGKIKHLLYFFFARYHLGYFYGWRGTWPE